MFNFIPLKTLSSSNTIISLNCYPLSLSVLSQFNFLNTSFLYLLAALDLHRCVQAFSTFGEWRLLSSRRLLIVVTPWSTGSRARELQQLKLTGSAEVAHGLRCLAEGGVFPDQASSQCPRRWKADSELLTHQGSLVHVFSLCLVPFHLCLIVFLSPFPLLKDWCPSILDHALCFCRTVSSIFPISTSIYMLMSPTYIFLAIFLPALLTQVVAHPAYAFQT